MEAPLISFKRISTKMVVYSILFFYLPTVVIGSIYVNLLYNSEKEANRMLIDSQKTMIEELIYSRYVEYMDVTRNISDRDSVIELLQSGKAGALATLLEEYRFNYQLENLFIFDQSCKIVSSPLTEKSKNFPLQCPVTSTGTVTIIKNEIVIDTIIQFDGQLSNPYFLFTRYIVPLSEINRMLHSGFKVAIIDKATGLRQFMSDPGLPRQSILTKGETKNRKMEQLMGETIYRLKYFELERLSSLAGSTLEIAVPKSLYRFRFDSLSRFVLLILIIWIISIVLFFILQHQQTVIPLEQLLHRALIITKGDYTGKMMVRSQDEIGQLADKFNIMAESLQKKENMLKLINEKLEKIVIQRTKTLKLTLDKLRDYDNIKTDFFYSIVHDLKNPLTVISGYANMIMDYDHFTREKKEEFLNKISTESEHMIDMLNDFLTTLREEHNLGRMDFSSIDLVAVLQYFFNIYEIQAQENRVELIWDVEIALPKVFGNRDKLEHVFSNLFSNAFKFTKPGGSITIIARKEGKYVLCGISDTGSGIEEGMERAVFEKFKKSESSKKGTGLGLYIAQQIIINHNGRIWVESQQPPS